ncbi:MAG: MarR family winged helix-turn-helix transcriptional regulator [Clostridia bacterium]|nr:MarR family winged helix-turn-helix transcriptional regulator [Clostridia bacterium]
MENKRLYGKMCYLHRQMYRENVQMFAEHGVSPVQMHAMVFIRKRLMQGEKVMQKDIEKFINLRASSVSTLISNLESKGFITRSVSDGDGRAKYIELTEKGNNICMKDRQLMEKCDSAIQSALGKDEQEEFERLLTKIIDSVSENK